MTSSLIQLVKHMKMDITQDTIIIFTLYSKSIELCIEKQNVQNTQHQKNDSGKYFSRQLFASEMSKKLVLLLYLVSKD